MFCFLPCSPWSCLCWADVQFWRSRKSLEGLSVRSVFFNVFQSLIVLLYILDNETNTMVIVMVFVGLLIDLWKVTKVVEIKIDRENLIAGFVPRLTFVDRPSYVQTSTKEYDKVRIMFPYLCWIHVRSSMLGLQPCRWRSSISGASSSRSLLGTGCTPFSTRSTKAGTPFCLVCATGSSWRLVSVGGLGRLCSQKWASGLCFEGSGVGVGSSEIYRTFPLQFFVLLLSFFLKSTRHSYCMCFLEWFSRLTVFIVVQLFCHMLFSLHSESIAWAL